MECTEFIGINSTRVGCILEADKCNGIVDCCDGSDELKHQCQGTRKIIILNRGIKYLTKKTMPQINILSMAIFIVF